MNVPLASRHFKAVSEGEVKTPSPSLPPTCSLILQSLSGPVRLTIVSVVSLRLSLPRLRYGHTLCIGFEWPARVAPLPAISSVI